MIWKKRAHDGEINIEYSGHRFELRILTAWIAFSFKSHNFDVKTICDQFTGSSNILTDDFFKNPVVNIQIDDNSGYHTMSDISHIMVNHMPPWFRTDNLSKGITAIKAGRDRFEVSNENWNSLICKIQNIENKYEVKTDESAWDIIYNNHFEMIVTDSPVVARMTVACNKKALYVGGVDPFHEWWLPHHVSKNKLYWLKTIDNTSLNPIKFCNCYNPKICHIKDTSIKHPCVNFNKQIKQSSMEINNIIKVLKNA